jgi:hypothetical protein
VEKEKNVNYEEIPVEGLRALLAEDNELNMESQNSCWRITGST